MAEQRAAQQALHESERRFRYLVESVLDYAIYMLDVNGVVTNWNRGAERAKGYRAEEIVGRHFSVFYTEEDRAAGMPARVLQTALEEGRYEAEAWRVRKDGSLFWANVIVDPIRDETGALLGFAKVTRDITERRDTQIQLQRAQERLLQAQKMEALGHLTGGVAHDFNNLLMVVSGQAQMLRRKVGDDPRALRAIQAIETSAERGQNLTRQLLTFARRQRLHPAVIQLRDRAASFQDLLDASLGETISLRIDLPEGLWPIEVDPGELELALLNLVTNARDAMPNGGRLTLSATNVSLSGEDSDLGLTGDFAVLTIEDAGAGIPPDILPRVFEPFFTTKDLNRGSGLGLSQVYGFAEQSGGRVTVESRLGQGSRFSLYLPRTYAASAEPTPAKVSDSPKGVAEILVVEDNPDVADVAAELLEQLGARPFVVSNAKAALQALHDRPRPDALFSDIVMAGEMDGLALARRVRAERPDVPILLTSGYSQSAANIGREFAILAKPYRLTDLSLALGAVMAAGPGGGAAPIGA